MSARRTRARSPREGGVSGRAAAQRALRARGPAGPNYGLIETCVCVEGRAAAVVSIQDIL